ncbi:MAG: hypothetical protein IKE33_05700 [Erysipelotrichaceae bacterium]|nr:hypothetical protein [Erysipelotrichaceae bacterium]
MGLFDAFKKKTEEAKKDLDTLAREVMHGTWGATEAEIKEKLTKAGYKNYEEIKAKADELTKKAEEIKKAAAAKVEAAKAAAKTNSVEAIAKEVIEGKWGNGQERKDKLAAAGYDFNTIQSKVNEILHGGNADLEKIAREVINGKWGNGQERKDKLAAAGYDYKAVQALVNKLLG